MVCGTRRNARSNAWYRSRMVDPEYTYSGVPYLSASLGSGTESQCRTRSLRESKLLPYVNAGGRPVGLESEFFTWPWILLAVSVDLTSAASRAWRQRSDH